MVLCKTGVAGLCQACGLRRLEMGEKLLAADLGSSVVSIRWQVGNEFTVAVWTFPKLWIVRGLGHPTNLKTIRPVKSNFPRQKHPPIGHLETDS